MVSPEQNPAPRAPRETNIQRLMREAKERRSAPPAVPSSAPAPTVETPPTAATEPIVLLPISPPPARTPTEEQIPPAPTAGKSLQEMNLIELEQVWGEILGQIPEEDKLQFTIEVSRMNDRQTSIKKMKDMSPEEIEVLRSDENGYRVDIVNARKLLDERQAAKAPAVPPDVVPDETPQAAVSAGGKTVPTTEQAPPAPTEAEAPAVPDADRKGELTAVEKAQAAYDAALDTWWKADRSYVDALNGDDVYREAEKDWWKSYLKDEDDLKVSGMTEDEFRKTDKGSKLRDEKTRTFRIKDQAEKAFQTTKEGGKLYSAKRMLFEIKYKAEEALNQAKATAPAVTEAGGTPD